MWTSYWARIDKLPPPMLVHIIIRAPSHPKKRKQVFYSLGNYVINRQDDGPWSPPLLTNSPVQLTQPLPFLLPWPPPSFPAYKLTPTSFLNLLLPRRPPPPNPIAGKSPPPHSLPPDPQICESDRRYLHGNSWWSFNHLFFFCWLVADLIW